MSSLYQLLADLVLVIHTSFVAFVVFGLALIVIGGMKNWSWVRQPVFRYSHLLAIAIVVLQAWLSIVCPLTTLENWLRTLAQQEVYSGSFIQHWLHAILFYRAEDWVFVLLYSSFAALVLLAWLKFPPRRWRQD